ncbi:hypothetical protein ACFQL1_12810 [Halomicroarcula sp. GCM10025709]|uniref:hypothetical protein n=1 Tax=Haloarcula TaxID=2237 RepID=UPI0024C33D66|nr:hypothetical protein [Halomicroarcula sp. YJ-61-S]
MQSLPTQLVQSIIDMPGKFIDIALADPISAILILIGATLVGLSSAVFGYLSLGAFLSLFSGAGGRQPPQAGR